MKNKGTEGVWGRAGREGAARNQGSCNKKAKNREAGRKMPPARCCPQPALQAYGGLNKKCPPEVQVFGHLVSKLVKLWGTLWNV